MQHDEKRPEDMMTKNVPDHCADTCRYLMMARPWAKVGKKKEI
jgi:hypothetical protein